MKMHPDKRARLLQEFDSGSPDAFFVTLVLVALFERSIDRFKSDRRRGVGIPFTRFGRSVRYQKRHILEFMVAAKASTTALRYRRATNVLGAT